MVNLDDQYPIDDRVQAFQNHQTGLLISLAGPGTGKTYSFLKRIDALVTRGNIQPEEICYLTFIKEIAKAFKSDYQEEFPSDLDDANRPRVSTLHSFACRLLRNRGYSIGYDGPLYFMSIADDDLEASQIFIDDLVPLVKVFGLNSRAQLYSFLQPIKQAWRSNIDPQTLPQPTPMVLDVALRLSRAYRLVDWDQAITLAHELYLDPANRDRWLTRLRHYLVDEYQDFNEAEQAFIATLASNATSMVIVGDDNQSIYSGRGGSPNGMRNLFHSPAYDQVSLLRCYRCKENILNAANRYLLWMSPAAQSMLPRHNGGSAHCYRFKSSRAEIEFLIEYLAARVAEIPENPSPKDGIVCLFPTHRVLDFYFDKIKPHIQSYKGKSEVHPKRLQLTRLLELVCQPNQRFLERIILESFTAVKPRH